MNRRFLVIVLAVFNLQLNVSSVAGFSLTKDYVFHFGDNYGATVYKKEGHIGMFQYTTADGIEIPYGKRVTHVKVTVDAVNSPTVEYDPVTQIVYIKFTFPQIPYSNYQIIVKAV